MQRRRFNFFDNLSKSSLESLTRVEMISLEAFIFVRVIFMINRYCVQFLLNIRLKRLLDAPYWPVLRPGAWKKHCRPQSECLPLPSGISRNRC